MDHRCQYTSTHCPNTRSLKISGELHRFCLFHRRSANAAQRRWKQKKAAATNAVNASTSEDDAIAKPTKSVTRRRQRQETDPVTIKPEAIATKCRRTNREIAAPRFYHDIQLATNTMEFAALPFDLEIDALPALFENDDMGLLNKLVLEEAEVTHGPPKELSWESLLSLRTPVDCWWSDPAWRPDASLML